MKNTQNYLLFACDISYTCDVNLSYVDHIMVKIRIYIKFTPSRKLHGLKLIQIKKILGIVNREINILNQMIFCAFLELKCTYGVIISNTSSK